MTSQDSPVAVYQKRTRLRGILLMLGVLLAVLITGGLVGEHHLKGTLIRLIAARTGRHIEINGALSTHFFSPHPTLTAEQVIVGNPPWSPPGVFAKIGRLTVVLDWQLSDPPLGLERLQIDGATLNLIRDAAGEANWHLHEGGPGKGPPLIRSLSMPDVHVELDDARRHLKFSGTVSAGDVTGSADPPPLLIAASGDLNGRPVSVQLKGDPLATVRRDHPYEFTFEERSSGTHLHGSGSIEQPFDFRITAARFAAAGEDLKDLYFLVGLRLPDTGRFELSGKLSRRGKRFEYTELTITSGESDIGGTLSVDSSSGRVRLEGGLRSRVLRAADLGARAAGRVPAPQQNAALRLPDAPLPLSGMRRSDSRVRFQADSLEVAGNTLRSVSAVISIQEGKLAIDPFKAGVAGGALSGTARLDASHDMAHGELSLSLADIHLEELRSSRDKAPPLAGSLSARLRLSGQGQSFHELAASANGSMTAVLPHGAMRASLAELAGLDLTGALGVVLSKGDEQTGIRCGVVSFEAHEGVVTAQTLVIDTDKVLIHGDGTIRMDSEALDLTLHGKPKRPGLVLHSAVFVRGTLAHPALSVEKRDVALQAGAAVALGVLLTPVAALLAFVDPGLAHNADCATLLAEAKTTAPAAVAAPAHTNP